MAESNNDPAENRYEKLKRKYKTLKEEMEKMQTERDQLVMLNQCYALSVSAADLAKYDRITPTSLIRALTVRCFPNEYNTVTSVRGLDQTRVSGMMVYHRLKRLKTLELERAKAAITGATDPSIIPL
ncbi:unnamed protein product [Didymodactylos carnosus]|uniref:Uncharacterized protein n=1 Tax=Didymodactylos carnosus TaxID=1234261 RepID=A0A815PBQ5_9BILA|nr:unnamed protein product [Didymodactylos carnosus]CAF4321205.1 unnamed protein product [Didymodactylos carnosus]